MIDQVDRLLHK
jgi:hypothetical protein